MNTISFTMHLFHLYHQVIDDGKDARVIGSTRSGPFRSFLFISLTFLGNNSMDSKQ